MQLKEIYQPIAQELEAVEKVLKASLGSSKHKSILEINNYLLNVRGKRLRPALVILCAKAGQRAVVWPSVRHELINIAAAVELIHMASLVHDDVIDHSNLRHNKPTVNCRRGEDVAIAAGDYLYSAAFELISTCNNMDVLQCLSSATKAMCEGELLQVCERDNPDFLEERYLIIVKKKTASLFAASCQSGAMLANRQEAIQAALKQYGLNFGIAFQVADDCLDLISGAEELGKQPGADFKMGEMTLPVLNLLSQAKDKQRILSLLQEKSARGSFCELKQRFITSSAFGKTKNDILSFIKQAKNNLGVLEDSVFKNSLFSLAELITQRIDL